MHSSQTRRALSRVTMLYYGLWISMATGVKGILYDSPCEWILRQSVRIDTCLSTTALQVASTDRVISNRLTEASRRRRLSLRSFVIRGRPLPFLRLSEPSLGQALHAGMIVESLRLNLLTISRKDNPASGTPTIRPLSKGVN
jgi:hypothetical protein